jgi:hypothetical protein
MPRPRRTDGCDIIRLTGQLIMEGCLGLIVKNNISKIS